MSDFWSSTAILVVGFAVNAAIWFMAGRASGRNAHARTGGLAEFIGSQIIRQVMQDGNAVTVRPCPGDPGSVFVGDLESIQKTALNIAAMQRAGAEEIRLIHDASCDAWVATALSRHPMGDGTGTGVDRGQD